MDKFNKTIQGHDIFVIICKPYFNYENPKYVLTLERKVQC